MGYSNVELANQALDHLGKNNIASLTEESVEARKMNAVFDRTIESALARSAWSFTNKIAELALVEPNDWTERWAYKYDRPTEAVRILRLIPRVDIQNAPPLLYELHGAFIYTNEADAKAEYTLDSTTTTSMPTFFLDAVSYLLARNVAMPLTRKRSFWDDMNTAYEGHILMAMELDAGQEPNSYVPTSNTYLDARGGEGQTVSNTSVDGSIYWE